MADLVLPEEIRVYVERTLNAGAAEREQLEGQLVQALERIAALQDGLARAKKLIARQDHQAAQTLAHVEALREQRFQLAQTLREIHEITAVPA